MEGWQPWVSGALAGVLAALAAHPPRHYASWRAWTHGFYSRLAVYVLCGALTGLVGVWATDLLLAVPEGQNPYAVGLGAGVAGHVLMRIQWTGFGAEPVEGPVSALGWLARWFHSGLRRDTYNEVHVTVCSYEASEIVAAAARVSERISTSELSEPQRRIGMQDFARALEVMTASPGSPDGRPRLERLLADYVVNLHLPPDVLEAFRAPLPPEHAAGVGTAG